MIRAATTVAILIVAAACSSGRPVDDVVLITLDTVRADRLGAHGYDRGETPNLDALAAGATLFENGVAPASVTLTSHSTMFTGLNPYRHGVRYNAVQPLAEDHVTLAELLGDAGFATAAFPASFPVSGRFGLDQGFETYADLFEGMTDYSNWSETERSAGDGVDLALDWWRERAGSGRRFVWLHVFDAHWPYEPPFPFSVRFRGQEYDGEIAYLDRELGRFFDGLREAGDWDDLLLLVVGDHGEGLFEHGERWHSLQVYETTLHVPFIIKAPGAGSQRRVAEPVGLVDLAATVLDYVGIEGETDFDGISLRRYVSSSEPPRRDLYFEAMGGNIHYGWSPLSGLRRGDAKFLQGARPELYDVARDRAEAADLAALEPDRVRDLALALAEMTEEDEGSGVASVPLDEANREVLLSLGYIGSGPSGGTVVGEAVHPPDMVHLEQELLTVQRLVGVGEWAQANRVLDEVLKVDPKNRFALYFRSRGAMFTGDLRRAYDLAQVLTSAYPDSPEGPDQTGEVLSQMGRPAEAAQVYRQALAQHPQHFDMRYHLILSLVEAKKSVEALPEVEFMERAWPEAQATAVARAVVEAAGGRPERALTALGQAVDRGLKSLEPVEASADFAAVRALAGYEGLKRRVEAAAEEAEGGA